MTRLRPPFALALLGIVVACGSEDRRDVMDSGLGTATSPVTAGSASGTTGSDTSGGTGSTTAGSASGPDSGPDSGEDPKFDVGGASGGSGPGDTGTGQGCQGIDFLFVIDNSGSMADEQAALINSFPGFISSIESKAAELAADDFHIMIADTDGGSDPLQAACFLQCQQMGTCPFNPNCEFTCEDSIGTGKVVDGAGGACGVQGAQNYMLDDQPDLPGTFACIANVGTNGSGGELQARAVVAATGSEYNEPGGCNEGFLRDDAILVVTLITDEEDSPGDPAGSSPGDPVGWNAALVAAKKGNQEGIVMLGLVGDTGTPGAECDPLDADAGQGAEESPRLREFVSSFPNHVLGSVCAPDYTDFFQQAVDLIQTTCEDYVPPG